MIVQRAIKLGCLFALVSTDSIAKFGVVALRCDHLGILCKLCATPETVRLLLQLTAS